LNVITQTQNALAPAQQNQNALAPWLTILQPK
jgi:hypothetical protein